MISIVQSDSKGACKRNITQKIDLAATDCVAQFARDLKAIELSHGSMVTNAKRGWSIGIDDIKRELRGRNLACWCKPVEPCHGTQIDLTFLSNLFYTYAKSRTGQKPMKTLILALIGLGFCLAAKSASLSTTDGAIFNNITAQRADPDGLYIEYTLSGGGFGMSKVKFARLSQDQQKQFGYDPDKAKDYEAKVAKATEDARQESIRWEQTGREQRAARRAQENELARIMNDRIIALAQLKQAQADIVAPMAGGNNYGWLSGGGYGYGVVAVPQIGKAPRARTYYAPVVTPVPFPRLNTPRSTR